MSFPEDISTEWIPEVVNYSPPRYMYIHSDAEPLEQNTVWYEKQNVFVPKTEQSKAKQNKTFLPVFKV